MKLKSLLLGSAAALALSTGAQAADPIAEFVSLDVCDAYGISGVTISTDDTCVSLSGRVRYRYNIEDYDSNEAYRFRSRLDWNLAVEITSQTDGGPATAFFNLREAEVGDWRYPTLPGFSGDDGVGTGFNDGAIAGTGVAFDEAYVSFGDTTVLTAGRKDSLFDLRDDEDFFDWGVDFRDGAGGLFGDDNGDTISVETLLADGFTFAVALENLDSTGTAGFSVGYDTAGINVSAGVLFGDLYQDADDALFFVNADVELDSLFVSGSLAYTSEEDLLGLIYGRYEFDMFTLEGQVAANDDDEWAVGLSGSFQATEVVGVTLMAEYWEGMEDGEFTNADERFEVSATADFTLVENLTASAGLGYYTTEGPSDEGVFGTAGVTYEPGGGFRTVLDGKAFDNGDYEVNFTAQKSF